jgi:holin-like protein
MSRAHRVIQRSVWLQLGIVLACWLTGELLAHAIRLPIPGAILGLAIMLALLARRRLSAVSMRRGAEWLLADMLLFFVPAVLAVLNYPEFLGMTGLKVLFVILASTTAVMITTAFVVDGAYRWRAARGLASSDLC